ELARVQVRALQCRESARDRGRERGGAAEAASGRRVGPDLHVDAGGDIEPPHGRLREVHHTVERWGRVQPVVDEVPEVEGADPDAVVLPWGDRDVRAMVDRRGADRAAVRTLV